MPYAEVGPRFLPMKDGQIVRPLNTFEKEELTDMVQASAAIPAEVKKDIARCPFTATEWAIIYASARQFGEPVSVHALYQAVWGIEDTGKAASTTVRVNVQRIRPKLRALEKGYDIFTVFPYQYLFDRMVKPGAGYVSSVRWEAIASLAPDMQPFVAAYSTYRIVGDHALHPVFSKKEQIFVDYIALQHPRLVTLRELQQATSPDQEEGDRLETIRVNLSRARGKLRAHHIPFKIENVPQEGYRIIPR